MTTTWEEIKHLAADFKRIQSEKGIAKLSERNCVDLVNHLVKTKQLEVYYTLDAKSYITPLELQKEIYEELEANGGRVNVVQLQECINIDLTIIETKVSELLKNDPTIRLVTGQLISNECIRRMMRSLQESLQLCGGSRNLGEISQQFEMPVSLLREFITEFGGGGGGSSSNSSSSFSTTNVLVKAKIDGDCLYTEDFLQERRCAVFGYFIAANKPVHLTSNLIQHFRLSDRLFHQLLTDLLTEGGIRGSVSTNRALFLPQIFLTAQHSWATRQYRDHGCVSLDVMQRLAVAEPRRFLREHCPEGVPLTNHVISPELYQRFQCDLERSAAALDAGRQFVVLSDLLEEMVDFSDSDWRKLAQMLVKDYNNSNSKSNCDVQLCVTLPVLVWSSALRELHDGLLDYMKTSTEAVLRSNPGLLLLSSSTSSSSSSSVFQLEQGKRASKKQQISSSSSFSSYSAEQQSSAAAAATTTTTSSGGRRGEANKGGIGKQRGREMKTKQVKSKFYLNVRQQQQQQQQQQPQRQSCGDGDNDNDGKVSRDSVSVATVVSRKDVLQRIEAHFSGGGGVGSGNNDADANASLPLAVIEELADDVEPVLQTAFLNHLKVLRRPSASTSMLQLERSVVEGITFQWHATGVYGKTIDAFLRHAITAKLFSGEECQQLRTLLWRHLLRTECCDLFCQLLEHLLRHCAVSYDLPAGRSSLRELSNEQRLKLIHHLPQLARDGATELNGLLLLRDEKECFDSFYGNFQAFCASLTLSLPSLTKKREKSLCKEIWCQLVAQQQQLLTCSSSGGAGAGGEQLEAASFLLLTCRLLVSKLLGDLPLTCPGRLVPKLVLWCGEVLALEDYGKLQRFQELVRQRMTMTTTTTLLNAKKTEDLIADDTVDALDAELVELTHDIRRIVVNRVSL